MTEELSNDAHPPLSLALEDISKRFGNVTALEHASLNVRPGSIHALLGENGAGKTTLMRIAFGMIKPDAGTIRIRGRSASFTSPADAITAGIGMVHQQFSLIPEMTVAENVVLGGKGKLRSNEIAAHVERIAALLGMTIDSFAKVKSLTASERQKVEIVRTFAHNASILILDEPTAVLTPRDIGDLFAQLRSFASNGGSVVLITHKLHDALEHTDEITILRKGRRVLNAPTAELDESVLADAMLGQSVNSVHHGNAERQPSSAVALELKNLTLRDQRGSGDLDDVTLSIKQNEIVGVAALEGAARSMLRLMAARIEPTAGEIRRPSSIGFVPEDRSQDALIPEFTLVENFALRNASVRTGRIDWAENLLRTSTIIDAFDVRTSGPGALISSLSGGNQQKFILGRELAGAPDLLILENPTQGLDVHAASAIHEKIRSARDAGTAVVFYSSDLDELATLSDRVIVVVDNKFIEVQPDRGLIGQCLLSVAAP